MMLEAWTPKRIRWSLRKVTLPVPTRGLVLEVGSGGNPHPAADVLVDRYIDTTHRNGASFVADRPAVLADACRMPFRDKTFDYVIAFHVLEHMPDPARFLAELQRVAKAGYIETPNILFERLVPYDVHLLEIMAVDGELVIYKKPSARHDAALNALDIVKRCGPWRRLFYGNPELFHVRYFWNDRIRYTVVNPDVALDWFVEPETGPGASGAILDSAPASDVRGLATRTLRSWYRWWKPRRIDLRSLLVCPACQGALESSPGAVDCPACSVQYEASHLPDFTRARPHGRAPAGTGALSAAPAR